MFKYHTELIHTAAIRKKLQTNEKIKPLVITP